MNNRYTIQRELGQGGMAIVYLAEDTRLQSLVALKVLRKELAIDNHINKRFVSEARSMFRMAHPNIIKVIDLIDEADTVAIVMEYVEGETLKQYIERKGKLSDNEIKDLLSQMLDAIEYVHEQGLVHRDIKPSNFMITPNGKVKLMDFGIAKQTDPNASDYTSTGTQQQMGTPMYMSPEQVHETKNVTYQSDIYSLGVVLWQMVSGQKPYDTKTLSRFQLESKIVNEPLGKTHSLWDELIQKATAKDMASRLINANAFKHALNGNNKKTESDATVIDSNVKQQPSPQPKANHANGSVREGAFSLDSKKSTVNQNSHLKEIFFGILIILGLISALIYSTSNSSSSSEESAIVEENFEIPTEANELLKQIQNNQVLVLFHGVGSEPFWDLYITQNELLYSVNEENTSYILLTPFDINKEIQTIKYKSSDDKTFEVTIKKEPASDGMSDETYPYSVIFSETELYMNGAGYIM